MEPPKFGDCYTAGEIAQKIYKVSTETLMAHSIRAVEGYLRQHYDFDTAIVLQPSKEVLSDMGRMSWCSVASNTGDPSYIFYQDDHPNWEKSHKRFCIAHELYHVIWAVGSSIKTPRRDRTAESVCDIFANELCRCHDTFYAEQATKQNADLRFQGLPFKSVT